jgi:hypothetical protein
MPQADCLLAAATAAQREPSSGRGSLRSLREAQRRAGLLKRFQNPPLHRFMPDQNEEVADSVIC